MSKCLLLSETPSIKQDLRFVTSSTHRKCSQWKMMVGYSLNFLSNMSIWHVPLDSLEIETMPNTLDHTWRSAMGVSTFHT